MLKVASSIRAWCSLIHVPSWPALSNPSADPRTTALASSERPSELPICDMMPFAKLTMAVNHAGINRKAFKQIRYV
jgi:hypothetical protein